MKQYTETTAIMVLAKWWKHYSTLGLQHRQSSRVASSVLAVNRSSLILTLIYIIAATNTLFYVNVEALLVFSVAAALCTLPIYLNSKSKTVQARLVFHVLMLAIFSVLGMLLPKAYWHFGNLYIAIAALFIFRRQLLGWIFCVLAVILFVWVEFSAPLIEPIIPIFAAGFYYLLSGMTSNVLLVMLIYHYYTLDDSGHIWWRENDGLFEAIVEGALDGVITIDEKGTVVGWNKQAQHIFGYNKNEVIGKELHLLIIPHQYREMHIKGMAHYLKTGEGPVLNKRIEIEAIDKQGRKFPVELAITPLPVDGEVLFNAFVRDITEIKEARENILAANKELQDFTSIVSHDLQEPLRTISGFCEILEEEMTPQNEKVNEYIKIISNSSMRMTQMLKDLLNYARTGKNALPPEKVNLNEVMKYVHQNLTAKLNETKGSLTYENLPKVMGHSTALIQLFQNLIANGMKFRKENELPIIHVDCKKEGEDWLIGIHDNGIGIDQKYFDKIFNPFIRLHSADQYEGSGIGLSVCKKIVEQYGGRIWAESEMGKGTTFWVAMKAVPNDQ